MYGFATPHLLWGDLFWDYFIKMQNLYNSASLRETFTYPTRFFLANQSSILYTCDILMKLKQEGPHAQD